MSEWVRLCGLGQLPPEGTAREFAVAGKVMCVARAEGQISAMDNECPHRGGPLAEGTIEEGKIVCPWHAWAFDRFTGSATHNPQVKVPVYPLKIDNGEVFIQLDPLA